MLPFHTRSVMEKLELKYSLYFSSQAGIHWSIGSRLKRKQEQKEINTYHYMNRSKTAVRSTSLVVTRSGAHSVHPNSPRQVRLSTYTLSRNINREVGVIRQHVSTFTAVRPTYTHVFRRKMSCINIRHPTTSAKTRTQQKRRLQTCARCLIFIPA